MLEQGTDAPDFTLPDQDGNDVTLSGLKGQTRATPAHDRAATYKGEDLCEVVPRTAGTTSQTDQGVVVDRVNVNVFE
jgi:hypothetical protein